VNDPVLTAVLPLRVDAQRRTSDLDRLERLLLPSFERFWQHPETLELLVIVPPGNLERLEARVGGRGRVTIRVLSDDAVCPTLSGKFGWHKQQILKLAAANVVSTPWYLTLDADVMLRRSCGWPSWSGTAGPDSTPSPPLAIGSGGPRAEPSSAARFIGTPIC
jgi:hypothetical protein